MRVATPIIPVSHAPLKAQPRGCTIVQMKVVADTSVFLAVALEEPEKARILDLTRDAEICAPEILPYEIGNALSAMHKRRQLSRREAERVYRVTQQIPVRLLSVDIAKALSLALTSAIYAYDAFFLQCARAQACALLTLDRRMREVAADIGVDTLE